MLLNRFTIFLFVMISGIAFSILGFTVNSNFYWPLLIFIPLICLGIRDFYQTSHSILRNYPIIAHFRFILEAIRPEIRQYLIEDDRDPIPFTREQRTIVYLRAKNILDKVPFGTVKDVYAPGYSWISHSLNAHDIEDNDFRITIGNESCTQPYRSSILNVSGISFGALGENAVRALNKGAQMGNFAQDTGEGSISSHHRINQGDLVWQIGTGYFGCRDKDGNFSPELFAENAKDPQVKMIEIKLSQGAKPGHGGVLPKAKITEEIATTRGISQDVDCISPPSHSAFSTPLEFIHFIKKLRHLSDGKPVGFKLCIGHRYEFLAIVKAMIETKIFPDFIVIDGKEGGTGAAPLELTNHIGLPLADGLTFVRNALLGANIRDKIKIGASGKLITGYDLCRTFALGADFVNSARGFMFALGCIQSRSCHTNKCPTGVTTQDPWRQRALVVEDKAQRVYHFQKNTRRAVAQILGAAGLSHPEELKPWHLFIRHQNGEVQRGEQSFPLIEPGAFLEGSAKGFIAREWNRAQVNSFSPQTDS